MKLSEIKNNQIKTIHDSEFESLGLLSYQNPKMLVYIDDEKYIPIIDKLPNISCILTNENIVPLINKSLGIAISNNPQKTFYEIHNYLASKTNFYWKPFKSIISKSSEISSTVYISENNVKIGERCKIGPHVSILEGSIINNDVIIRAGSVISTEGFQMKKFGAHVMPIIHAGGVIIHDRVEMQANCCISKALFGGYTEIGEDSKFDNLVHIAHNVRIGKRCMAAACAMIAGSVTVGDDVWIGPSASISSEVEIGNNAFITIGSVVTKNVPCGGHVSGNFAIDHDKFISFIRSIR